MHCIMGYNILYIIFTILHILANSSKYSMHTEHVYTVPLHLCLWQTLFNCGNLLFSSTMLDRFMRSLEIKPTTFRLLVSFFTV